MPPVDQHGLSEDSLRGSEQFALPREEMPAPVPTGKFEPTSEQELAAVRRAGLRLDARPAQDFPTKEPPTQTAPNSGALGIADWSPDQVADTNPGGDRDTEPAFDVQNPAEGANTDDADYREFLEWRRRQRSSTTSAEEAYAEATISNLEQRDKPTVVRGSDAAASVTVPPGGTLPTANPNS